MTETYPVGPATLSSRSSVRFNPYVLWRRGMLPFVDLRALVPEGTWQLLDQSAKGRECRLELADKLADRLFEIIPRLVPDERRLLLKLRRDLHNDRLPQDTALKILDAKLDDSGRQLVDQWRQSRLADEQLLKAATDQLVSDLQTARKQLKDVASTEYFLRGIQLSGSNLYRDVRSYINREQPEARPSIKKLRQTENTVTRYAYRMSLRTSPFGCFTEIGAQPWLPSSTTSSGERRHVITLSRGLLTWMVYELRNLEGSEQLLMLRLNNTLQRIDDQFEAFTRGMDGGSNAYWGESFVKVKNIGPVALLIKTLAAGPRLKSEVVNEFVERGLSANQALTFIDGLIKAGVCHQDLALPDQVTSFAGEVATRLRKVPTEPAALCASVFERLQEIETELALATAEHREELLDELMVQVNRFSEICGVPPPPVVSRSFVFEDVAAQDSARSWHPEILKRNSDHFSRLLRLLPLFDDATYERLGLYHWFTSRFGESGHYDDLLAFYGEFSEQSDADISAIMQAIHDPHAERCRSLERTILERLDRAVQEAGDVPTLKLDASCLDEIAMFVSDVLRPWGEAAFRLQIVPGNSDSSGLVVLNDAMAGHGIFFSRFCDLVEPAETGRWSLRDVISDRIASDHPNQGDLTTVLALNVNLHPRLTPQEIVYPGSVASGSKDVLTVRDLSIKADPDHHTLRLFNRHDGRPVELTPMNFLFPAAAPRLYRFLCALAPLHSYRSGLWDRLQPWSRREISHLPRLMLGDLVLERRCWFLPLAEIKELGDGSNVETLSSLLVIHEWVQRHNLPRECFFQIHEIVEETEPGNWLDATRRWALNARTARRKGQYVDFRNPFLVRLLLKQAASIGNGRVLFQETLPPTQIYSDHSSLKSAEEFVIEMKLRAENASHSNYGEMA
ncbi:MAG TPA: lantibiotic dehydratase [Pyrinomonadaceae bacterium]|nr:lantibiotic dehydratase [Pyrinomonadaceae bacterium]